MFKMLVLSLLSNESAACQVSVREPSLFAMYLKFARHNPVALDSA
jgi:hypothetical protein